MFEKEDEEYLKTALNKNSVVLFLGSGFSIGAFNLLKENFPTGEVLGARLWDFLEYEGTYDGTPLAQIYQAFLAHESDTTKKHEFLKCHLTSSEIPELYDYVTEPNWRKIYSTNVDDVIEKTYKRNKKEVEEYIYPHDSFSEKEQSEQSSGKTKVVYLHGKLPCHPEEVVFSPQQYAKAQYVHEPLYEEFVHDYANYPTIFIGTELNEPLFERYIIARERRFDVNAKRPKSFLITPNLSPVKVDNLKNDYNVHHINGTTRDFLNWLKTRA